MDQFVSELSESEDEILQPVSKFSPPNDIITKDYPADEKPLLKLMYCPSHIANPHPLSSPAWSSRKSIRVCSRARIRLGITIACLWPTI